MSLQMHKREKEESQGRDRQFKESNIPAKRFKQQQSYEPSSLSKENEDVSFEISAKRKIIVRKWKNTVLVDVREFYDNNGTMMPGKKGISLSQSQWETLHKTIPLVDDAIDELKNGSNKYSSAGDHEVERIDHEEGSISYEISDKRRISIKKWNSSILVDIREFYSADGILKPGKKGISLSLDQWETLKENSNEIDSEIKRIS